MDEPSLEVIPGLGERINLLFLLVSLERCEIEGELILGEACGVIPVIISCSTISPNCLRGWQYYLGIPESLTQIETLWEPVHRGPLSRQLFRKTCFLQ